MNIKALSQVIAQRRSVFPQMYNDKPISKETIELLLENANWAPTHKKTEPWRWKVITGAGLQKLSEYVGEYYKSNTPKEKFSEIKYKKTIQKPLQSQAVIAICMYNDPDIDIPEWEEIAATAMAVQNMWLSCTSLGIGSYWSSPSSAFAATQFLNLEENEKCLGWFYLGKYDSIPLEGKRNPYIDKVSWISE